MSTASELKKNAPVGSVISKMSEEEIEKVLQKAAKQDAQAEKVAVWGARKRITDSLYILKAKKAGIQVSKEEVEREMKVRGYIK